MSDHPATENAATDDLATTRVLSPEDVERVLGRMAHDIADRYRLEQSGPLKVAPNSLALIGIRTGGAHLAARLKPALKALLGEDPPLGILDITLYRDDVLLASNAPVLKGTEIDFDIERRYVVVVDDVLYTGRTVRAALDALLDLGRPSCVRLAVLVDRGLRELPVAADVVGRELVTKRSQRVSVRLREEGEEADEVRITESRDRRAGDVSTEGEQR